MTRALQCRFIVAMAAALLIGGAGAGAHDNLLTQFDMDNPITLRGRLIGIDWVNPHSWIRLAVDRGDGQVETWRVETGSLARMKAAGLEKSDFVPGTEVVVIGFAARKGTTDAAGFTITFAGRQASFLLGR